MATVTVIVGLPALCVNGPMSTAVAGAAGAAAKPPDAPSRPSVAATTLRLTTDFLIVDSFQVQSDRMTPTAARRTRSNRPHRWPACSQEIGLIRRGMGYP